MAVYIFVQYAHDTRWIRSRAQNSLHGILIYVRSLPMSAKIRIAVR